MKRLCTILRWLVKHKKETGAVIVGGLSIASVIVAIISLNHADRSTRVAQQQSKRELLSRLITEIITLSYTSPRTDRVEQAELASAEVAYPLAKEVSSTPSVDFYEIGSAFALADEAEYALAALQLATTRGGSSRPVAFAYREEAGVLFRRGRTGDREKARRDLARARHVFDGRREPMLVHLDAAFTDLYEAIEAEPAACRMIKKDIAKAQSVLHRDHLYGNEDLKIRLGEAERRASKTCATHTPSRHRRA